MKDVKELAVGVAVVVVGVLIANYVHDKWIAPTIVKAA